MFINNKEIIQLFNILIDFSYSLNILFNSTVFLDDQLHEVLQNGTVLKEILFPITIQHNN